MSKEQAKPPTTDKQFAAKYDPKIARRLLEFIWPYRLRYALGFAFMLVESAAVVGGPYLVSLAIDNGIAVGDILALRNAVLLYLLLVSLQWVTIYTRINIMAHAGQSVIYDLRARLFEEKKGTYRECYEETCQIELGKALAAQKSLSTKILKVGKRCAISSILFDFKTETAEQSALVRTDCDEDSLFDCMDRVARQFSSGDYR